MKTKLFSLLAFSAIVFIACENDDNDPENDRRVKFISSITAPPETKVSTDTTGISTWEVYDRIGIYMVETGTTNMIAFVGNNFYEATSSGASTSFRPWDTKYTIYYPKDTSSKVDFVAYYPSRSIIHNRIYPVDVRSQTPQASIDLMYAAANNSGAGYNATSAAVDFTFSHQLVKLILNVSVGQGVTGPVSSVSIKGMNTSANFDLEGANRLTDLGTPQAITPYTAATGTKYEAILLPVAALNSSHTVTFTTTNNETYTLQMSDDITALAAGSIYVYDITVTRHAVNATGSITKWTVGSKGTGIAD